MTKMAFHSLSVMVLLGVVMLIGSPSAYATPCTVLGDGSCSLADLSTGTTIQSGDKIFFDFSGITQSPNNIGVQLTDIHVLPILSGSEYGIRFQASVWAVASNQSYDLAFGFSAMRVDGLPLIHDNTLEIVGAHDGTGNATISETVTEAGTFDTLAEKLVYINFANTGLSKVLDHKIFAHDAAVIDIEKDFALNGGPHGLAFVSHFDQTFSQTAVPEPSTVVLLGIGLLGMVGYGWQRRR